MDISHTFETDTATTDASINSTEPNTTNDSRINDNELELPFFISDDKRTIKKTKYYFQNLLDITWKTNITFNDYLNEIDTFKNKFFDTKNYNEIVLNQLQLKQLMDLRLKNKECMKNLVYLSITMKKKYLETYHKWNHPTVSKLKHSTKCSMNFKTLTKYMPQNSEHILL